ncbi:MAG: hypothetical protein ACR2FE_04535 [Aeromicrobium sp.]
MKRLAAWCALMLALGVAGGLSWFWLAEPGEWVVNPQGLVRSEDELRGQFAGLVTFVLVGVVLCFVWGWVAGHVLRDIGWLRVPVFALVPGIAALIAWRVGVALGPSDPRELVDDPRFAAGLSLGDRLPAQLEIDAVAPFLVWPMFALAGLLLAAWLERSEDDPTAEPMTQRV